MTYSFLFQHNAPVSASFTPLRDDPNFIPGKRGVIDLKLGALTTQITPSEARQLAADLWKASTEYEAHLAPLSCAECGGGSFDGHRDACLYRPEPASSGEIEAYAANPGT